MRPKRSALLLSISLLLSLIVCIELARGLAPPRAGEVVDGPDSELENFQFRELEARLKIMPSGTQRDYFAGVLANREGRTDDSIRLLESALPAIRASHPDRAAIALEALADDYNKSFRYDDAARIYDDLLANFSEHLGPQKLQGTKDDAEVMHLLRGAPAQTITWQGPVRLRTERNILGSVDTELTVNGVKEQWLLDTGANFSVVSKGFAHRLGLNPLPGFAQTMSGVTGIENPLQVAVMPALEIGGATLHNVVVLILDDANLKVPLGKEAYQINGIIGYPVFQALGVVTFLHEGWFEAGDAAPRSAGGTKMYMKQLTPVIECGIEGQDLPFSLDTGASGTDLSIRYFEKFREKIKTWKKTTNKSFGAGGVVKRKNYLQPRLNLRIGEKTVTLKRVSIFPMAVGSDLDELYGNLGQDIVAGFDSFTLDFSKMTFNLGAPLPDQSAH